MKKYFFLLTLASLLLLGAGCSRGKPVSSDATQIPVASPKAPVVQDNSITAQKQTPHEYANVASVTLAVRGFVAIHEDAGGKPGSIIGKSQVFKVGVYTVTVSLNRPSKVGEILYAMLHGEDEAPLKDIKGVTAMSAFTIARE